MTRLPAPTVTDAERVYDEAQAKDKAMAESIVDAIQELVAGTTDDECELARCGEICDAIIAFAFTRRRTPLRPHDKAMKRHLRKRVTDVVPEPLR